MVAAEGFDYFFVALHEFDAFSGCSVDVFSAFSIDFEELRVKKQIEVCV